MHVRGVRRVLSCKALVAQPQLGLGALHAQYPRPDRPAQGAGCRPRVWRRPVGEGCSLQRTQRAPLTHWPFTVPPSARSGSASRKHTRTCSHTYAARAYPSRAWAGWFHSEFYSPPGAGRAQAARAAAGERRVLEMILRHTPRSLLLAICATRSASGLQRLLHTHRKHKFTPMRRAHTPPAPGRARFRQQRSTARPAQAGRGRRAWAAASGRGVLWPAVAPLPTDLSHSAAQAACSACCTRKHTCSHTYAARLYPRPRLGGLHAVNKFAARPAQAGRRRRGAAASWCDDHTAFLSPPGAGRARAPCAWAAAGD